MEGPLAWESERQEFKLFLEPRALGLCLGLSHVDSTEKSRAVLRRCVPQERQSAVGLRALFFSFQGVGETSFYSLLF